jgi:hypothetical protein
MPYKLKKINGGYKVCKTSGKCFSKKPLSKKKAEAQRAAIAINTYESSNTSLIRLIEDVLNNNTL